MPQKEANYGKEINATRDISGYTLGAAYCIDKNIPALELVVESHYSPDEKGYIDYPAYTPR